MSKRLTLVLTLILFLSIVVVSVPTRAQSTGNIVINLDGLVTGTNNIQHIGNTYTFTANITGNIEIRTNSIIINGSGYTLNGNNGLGIDLNDPNSYPTLSVSNVTIENLFITNCGFGILSNGGGDFTFYNDYLSNCKLDACIMLIGASYNNITYCTLIGSNVTESIGMVEGASYNTITENNLIGSGVNVFQSVSETIDNNYWVSSNGSIQGSVLNKPVSIPLTGSNPLGTLPSPTSTIPELSWLAIIPLMISMLSLAVVLRHRKTSNLSK